MVLNKAWSHEKRRHDNEDGMLNMREEMTETNGNGDTPKGKGVSISYSDLFHRARCCREVHGQV